MQTSTLNIWGLQPAEVTPNTTGKSESGFEGILDQALPTGETMTDGILGETGLEAGSNGPIALDQELDQAAESQTSSDLIALMMAGAPAPQQPETAIQAIPTFAVVTMASASEEAVAVDLLAKKDARIEHPTRTATTPEAEGIELSEGFEALEQPEIYTGVASGAQQVKAASNPIEGSTMQPAELKAANQSAVTAIEGALPENTLPFAKSNDPIGQLLNERWQAWVKQNYAGPLVPQNPAAMMPAAMNTAFSAAAQSGQITLAQAEVKPVTAAVPAISAAVTSTEEATAEGLSEGESVEAPAPANPNFGGAFSAAIRAAVKPAGQQNDQSSLNESSEVEDELGEAFGTESDSVGQSSEISSEQARVQGKEQVQPQAQSQPLTVKEEKEVAKQASKTLQDMIEANKPKTMTIRMNPDDLGSLTIKVRQFGNRVEAEVSASLDSVRQALTNQKQELAAAVENRGAQLTNLIIKSESAATDPQPNNSFSQNGSSGDGRTHQEAQQEANRFARLTAAISSAPENQPERTQVRTGPTSRFDLTA